MISSFLSWLAFGLALRVAAGLVVAQLFHHRLCIPNHLTSPLIVLAVLAKLTWMLPLPLGLVLGLLLLDTVVVAR